MSQKVALVTKQVGWILLREKVTADDTDVLGVTTRNFANLNVGTGKAVKIPEGINGIIVTFLGILANHAKPFKWKLYGYRTPMREISKGCGPAQLIAYGTGNLGDVAVVTHPLTGATVTAYYADELTITAQKWLKTVAVYDVGGASGEIATIVFDGMGISHLLCELTDCYKSEAGETDELEAIYTGG